MTTTQHSFRSIRLFLSSTFRDMNSERDFLVTYVFPRIHEYCSTRFIEFIPIDLRWGIPEEESRNGLVLTTCLEEVDNSRPFFIGILGSRYGWMPTEPELAGLRPSVEEHRSWLNAKVLESASITEIEMEYGALRNMDTPHACFFIRSAEVEIPDDFKEPIGSVAADRLLLLKQKICSQSKYPVYEYSSPEQLGEIFLRDIIAMVEVEYPVADDEALDTLIGRHKFVLERRSNILCDISNVRRNFSKWIEDGTQLLLLRGPSGSGTSTGLAYSVVDLQKTYPENKILYYDFEITELGQDPVDSFLKFLSLDQCKLPENQWSMIAVDNSSQLDASEVERIMQWIDSLHGNIHVSFATATNSPLNIILQYRYDCPSITVYGLTHQMQREFINNFTLRFGKRFTEEQIKVIIAGEHSNDPTVLSILLNSLINFGSVDQLDNRIQKLIKGSNYSLFSELLYEGRDAFQKIGILREFTEASVAISLLPEGISEAELLSATGMSQSKWSIIRPYILQFCKGNSDRLTFIASGWSQDVKNFWGTPFRAAIGIKLIDWYLADQEHLPRAAKAISSIYADIWHLPFEDDEYNNLKEKILSVALSPTAVNVLNNASLSILWGLLSSRSMHETSLLSFGRSLSDLSQQEAIKYYLRLAHVASSQSRGIDASFCYERVAQLKEELNQHDAFLYRAMAFLEVGHASQSLEIIDALKLVKTKANLLFHFSFGRPKEPIDFHVQLKALVLYCKALMFKGDWISLQKAMKRLSNFTNALDERTPPLEIESYIEGLAMMCYVFSSYNPVSDIRRAVELSQKISEYISRLGVGHPLSYQFLIAKTFCLLKDDNFSEMLNTAYWAQHSAWMAFGGQSYQYDRANILYTYAHFKLHGTYGIHHQTMIYSPKNYARSLETRHNKNIDWSLVDLDVRREIIRERDLFRKLIRDIQPLSEQKRMDSEPDTLREQLGL